jgi:hypothetical protein
MVKLTMLEGGEVTNSELASYVQIALRLILDQHSRTMHLLMFAVVNLHYTTHGPQKNGHAVHCTMSLHCYSQEVTSLVQCLMPM